MLGVRKLLEKHAKWSETTVLSHLFAFDIEKFSLSSFSFFVSSKMIELEKLLNSFSFEGYLLINWLLTY